MSRISGLTIVLIVVVVVVLLAILLLFQSPTRRADLPEVAYSQLLAMKKTVRDVTISGNALTGHDITNRAFATRLPADPTVATRLADAGVVVVIGEPPDPSNWVTTLFVNGIPLLLSLLWLWPLYRIARALERGVETNAASAAEALPGGPP